MGLKKKKKYNSKSKQMSGKQEPRTGSLGPKNLSQWKCSLSDAIVVSIKT